MAAGFNMSGQTPPSAAVGTMTGWRRGNTPQPQGKPEQPRPQEEMPDSCHDSLGRRHHERLAGFGAWVTVDPWRYPVHDLSLGGFKIFPYAGELCAGQTCEFLFRLVVHHHVSEFPVMGTVMRIDENGLVATYEKPDPAFYRLIAEYIEEQHKLNVSYAPGPKDHPPGPGFVCERA